MGMPRNTIQISEKRISTSLHSAGCSSTKRVTIWNTPRAEAMTSIRQASAMAMRVVQLSSVKTSAFMILVRSE
jgi:hypothetical protein